MKILFALSDLKNNKKNAYFSHVQQSLSDSNKEKLVSIFTIILSQASQNIRKSGVISSRTDKSQCHN
jgi:hypothetical protein